MRRDYVRRWEDIELLPGSLEALARLTAAGCDLVVLTNQSAIGRGLVSRATVDDINRRLAEAVEQRGGRIRSFLICPHAPADGCDCRKPRPGLLLRARDELGIDLSGAVMIGDQMSDVDAAHAAGCFAILIDPERAGSRLVGPDGTRVAATLGEAADLILGESANR
jgi:D-glycero-D-manno-heptose 1,7-bisphosphate phosphatase